MGIIKSASASSCWRGLDYYNDKKVINYKKINEYEYEGEVFGSGNKKYKVLLNLEHPRSSKCNCPHANGKKIVCKHMVALYFTIFPKEADKFIDDAKKAEEEYQDYRRDLYKKVIAHIHSMSKKELIDALIYILNVAPEWIYDEFVRDHVGFEI